jgi:rubrerythrin
MKKFNWVNEILDFAIEREIEAQQFYTDLAAKMDNPVMSEVFESFAREEKGHEVKLKGVKAGKIEIHPHPDAPTLDIADYVVDVEPSEDMTYTEALVVAMKKEKAAYRLYLDLAAEAATEELTNTFLWLAGEEARHKLRFEIEYDDMVLRED